MTRRLFACWFGSPRWRLASRILEASAREHCRDWQITIERIEPPGRGKYLANVAKLSRWVDYIDSCDDGDCVALLDCDCFIARPLDSAWSLPFDLAITYKWTTTRPINAGAVFLRVSGRTRAFLREWLAVNRTMLADRLFHLRWERRYAGINQAALGYLLDCDATLGLDLRWLDAREWNACNADGWSNRDARVYHVKSQLRRAADSGVTEGPYAYALTEWRRLAAEVSL